MREFLHSLFGLFHLMGPFWSVLLVLSTLFIVWVCVKSIRDDRMGKKDVSSFPGTLHFVVEDNSCSQE